MRRRVRTRHARRARVSRKLMIASVVGLVLGALVAPAVARAATPLGPRTGVSAGSVVLWESDAERRADLDFIAASGAKWFTMDVDWPSVQPTRNTWNWTPTDKVVRDARARGLNIIATLAYSPRWAAPASCPTNTTHCLPANPADYARFASAAALRYGNASPIAGLRSSIETWQIWNEPNHYPFVQPPVSPAAYTALLKQAYVAIHRADFWTTVLAGGTSPAGNDPLGRDMLPLSFLEYIYAFGGKGYFDGFAHHPYSFPCDPLTNASWNSFTQTPGLYMSMAAHGDGTKKVWGTEIGAPTGADVGTCAGGNGTSVTEPVQAWLANQMLTDWNVTYGAFTGPLVWYQIRDNGTNPMVTDDNFGLLRRNYTAKPSFQVFSAAMKGG